MVSAVVVLVLLSAVRELVRGLPEESVALGSACSVLLSEGPGRVPGSAGPPQEAKTSKSEKISIIEPVFILNIISLL